MANLSKDRIRHESLCGIRGRAYKIEVVKCLARKKEGKKGCERWVDCAI